MITVDGRQYGTRQEIADALGDDVTPAMVRNWTRRDGLDGHLLAGVMYHPLDQAAAIERAKRLATRGRPRRVDVGGTLAA